MVAKLGIELGKNSIKLNVPQEYLDTKLIRKIEDKIKFMTVPAHNASEDSIGVDDYSSDETPRSSRATDIASGRRYKSHASAAHEPKLPSIKRNVSKSKQ